MDEPFGALDAQTREIMQELILNVFQYERTTIVFVTHDVDEAIYLGERVVVMAPRPGRIHSIHKVPFSGGRVPAWRMEPEFLGLKQEILNRIRQTAGIDLDPTTFAKLRSQAAQSLS
jgi:NitT/TauT family transport system ATP-binding protein